MPMAFTSFKSCVEQLWGERPVGVIFWGGEGAENAIERGGAWAQRGWCSFVDLYGLFIQKSHFVSPLSSLGNGVLRMCIYQLYTVN